ncbi:LEC14B [Vanrija pseudolonga]|uniref:LEC14B n=1 Tax=Vanrija pseudolonga TaxID=143232 RepID=A0AAF0YE82_9TREE|nr:LEC14B [Vanrija pseudolonga]
MSGPSRDLEEFYSSIINYDDDDEEDDDFDPEYIDNDDIHEVVHLGIDDGDEDDDMEFDGEGEDDDEEDEDDDEDDPDYRPIVVEADDDDESDDDDDNVLRIGGRQLLELLAQMNSTNGISSEDHRFLSNIFSSPGISIPGLRRAQQRERGEDGGPRADWRPKQTEPHPAGVALLRSGEFGPVGPWAARDPRLNSSKRPHRLRPSERYAWRRARAAGSPFLPPGAEPIIPNTHGTVVAYYPSVPYVGQFCGPDYGVFYSATQYFTLHLYSTTQPKSRRPRQLPRSQVVAEPDTPPAEAEDSDDDDGWVGGWPGHRRRPTAAEDTSMRKIKTVQGVEGQWTITDADADRKGERMIYSSITPYVHMLNTAEHDEDHHQLDFTSRTGRGYYGGMDHFGIWSIRFSADGKEIVAGASAGRIMVYDINADTRTLAVQGHRDDVNAVCFADESSTNILISGSDDGYVKVWDRRSLSSHTPSGVLAGATEGITYTAPKGDGRYIAVNSKDQAARLYDLRKMRSWSEFEDEPDAVERWGCHRFDYRSMRYPRPKLLAHPRDCSVMTFRGHSVLRTLIRCHFSPVESTGQQYIYSGSADGLIHIWSLDGRVVQVLNRAESVNLRDAQGRYNDPSAPEPVRRGQRRGANAYDTRGLSWTVRDVAWHGFEPTLMSTCWEVEGQHRHGGSIAKHEWKGLGKGGLKRLEDWVDKAAAEAAETERLRTASPPSRIPGAWF